MGVSEVRVGSTRVAVGDASTVAVAGALVGLVVAVGSGVDVGSSVAVRVAVGVSVIVGLGVDVGPAVAVGVARGPARAAPLRRQKPTA